MRKLSDIDTKETKMKIIGAFLHSVFLYDDKIVIIGNYSDDKGARTELTLSDVDSAISAGGSESEPTGRGSDLAPSGA